MFENTANPYYKLVLLLSILVELSMTYRTLSTDDHRLCSAITTRKIKLGQDDTSGLIVNLGRTGDHYTTWDKNFLCKFLVDPSNTNHGLFAVIQNIIFRKNETTDECIDYVQYKRRDASSSKKYCGRFTAALAMDHIFAPDAYATNLAPTANSFVVPVGQLHVTIYIAKDALKLYDEMDLEIVFTSFRPCFMALDNDRKCSDKYSEFCIYKGFFNDEFVNCPHPDCVDEKGCSEKVVHEGKKSVGDKVVIGSVTLILVFFVFFICFIWLCRKYKKLCWAEEFANSNQSIQAARSVEENLPPTREIAMPNLAARTSTSVEDADPNEEDKDLPPSYDSLFPNR